MLKAIVLAWLLLFIGDLLSTFLYHIPEHVFGNLHLKTHHSVKKDFRHYAVLSFNFDVILEWCFRRHSLHYSRGIFMAIFTYRSY
jgi:hypothetical protein